MYYLSYLCLFVQHILCCVFVLFFLVLCTLYCQFLCIVHFLMHLRYYLTFILYFTADDGKLKDRVGDFKRINSSLKMPKNPSQQGKLTYDI